MLYCRGGQLHPLEIHTGREENPHLASKALRQSWPPLELLLIAINPRGCVSTLILETGLVGKNSGVKICGSA